MESSLWSVVPGREEVILEHLDTVQVSGDITESRYLCFTIFYSFIFCFENICIALKLSLLYFSGTICLVFPK
jgi:hypothetical protein